MVGTELATSTSYHPQSNGITDIVNKWVEGYLRNYVAGQHRTWIKWLHLGEYCYNTTYHMSIKMTPFKALYGYEALSFVNLAFEDSRAPKAKYWVQDSQDILKVPRRTYRQHRINRNYTQTDTGLRGASR